MANLIQISNAGKPVESAPVRCSVPRAVALLSLGLTLQLAGSVLLYTLIFGSVQ